MARPRQKTAFLGEQTVKILLGVPTKQAGWLIHALCDWIENDREPQDVEIPAPCIGAWIAIRDESVRIHDILKTARENGLKGGRPPKKPNETEMKPNGNQTETQKNQEEEEDEDIDSSPSPKSKNPKRAAPARRSSSAVDMDSSFSSPKEERRLREEAFPVWAKLCKDPVDAALAASGEGPDKRRVYGSFLRRLGKAAFLEAVCQFHAERAAGEEVLNPGAALVSRLKGME